MDDTYPYDAITGTAGHEHEKPDYNMQMVYHIEEKKDTNRDNLIDMEIFKPISGNTTKRLRM